MCSFSYSQIASSHQLLENWVKFIYVKLSQSNKILR
jgi:hypothetical protein